MGDFLEAMMILSFGISWPLNTIKNWQARSAKGMSLGFYVLITTGYVLGIIAKLITGRINYVLIVYVLNLLLVSSNLFVYWRNWRLDQQGGREA